MTKSNQKRHMAPVTAAVAALGLSLGTAQANPDAFDMQRCVNMGNSLEAPRGVAWGKPINLDDFAVIRSMGVDTVRIPARFSDYVGPGPAYIIEEAFMAEVKAAVDAALAAELNVMLDVHHYEEIMEDPKTEFRKFLSMWRQIATLYKDYPDDLWFEVLNEPKDALRGDLMRAAQRVGYLAIRETNPTRIVIFGGEEWSGIRTLDSNLEAPDENIVYTYHYYDPFDFTHQKASWLGDAMPEGTRGWGSREDKEELAAAIQTATAYRDKMERPVFLGEFGVYDEAAKRERVKWLEAVRIAHEEAEIPWCLWAYSNTFALYDNEKGRHDKAAVKALGLTMPPK